MYIEPKRIKMPGNVVTGMFFYITKDGNYSRAVVIENYDDCFVSKTEKGQYFRHTYNTPNKDMKYDVEFPTVNGEYVLAKRGIFGWKAKPSDKTVKDEPNE